MDLDNVHFPDAGDIAPHAIAFARMMFAHSEYEREVGSLQDAITNEQGFGELRENQWSAEHRAEKMVKLITKHIGDNIPQTAQIENILKEAVSLCRQRNFLAHGAWWRFNNGVITVRGGTRWGAPDLPPEHRDYTLSDIEALAEKFKDIEAELYKVFRSLEPRKSEDEIRAEMSKS